MFKQINRTEQVSDAIDLFFKEGEKIQGVHSLLLRGSGAEDNIPGWSDLDFSMILKCINHDRLLDIRRLYRQIRIYFPYKVSITVVSALDFQSPLHHHGGKPLYYSNTLEGRPPVAVSSDLISMENVLKIDCLANLASLIHDLRRQFIAFDETVDINKFAVHLLRKVKHIIRDACYILEGKNFEDIEPLHFQQHFPSISPAFLLELNHVKRIWPQISSDLGKVNALIESAYSFVEEFYELLLPRLNKLI